MLERLLFTGQKWYLDGFFLTLNRVKVIRKAGCKNKVMVNIGDLWYSGKNIWETVRGCQNSFWEISDIRNKNRNDSNDNEDYSYRIVKAIDFVRGVICDIIKGGDNDCSVSRIADITRRVNDVVISEKVGRVVEKGVEIDGVIVFVGEIAVAEIKKRECGLGMSA